MSDFMLIFAWAFINLFFIGWNVCLIITKKQTMYDDFKKSSIFEWALFIVLFTLLPVGHLILIIIVRYCKRLRTQRDELRFKRSKS